MIKLLILVVASFAVAGCASTYKPSSRNPALIHVSGDHRSLFDWDELELMTIDGIPAAGEMYPGQRRKIDSGDHRLLIRYGGNRKFIGKMLRAPLIVLRAHFEEGKKYDVKGEFRDNEVTVFVVDDATGNLISDRVSAPVEYYDPQSGAVIPIFIPVK